MADRLGLSMRASHVLVAVFVIAALILPLLARRWETRSF
jgi:hypothetical protein